MLKNCLFIFYPLSFISSKILFKKTPLPHVKKTEFVPSILDSKYFAWGSLPRLLYTAHLEMENFIRLNEKLFTYFLHLLNEGRAES